jgi:hypothetical protein
MGGLSVPAGMAMVHPAGAELSSFAGSSPWLASTTGPGAAVIGCGSMYAGGVMCLQPATQMTDKRRAE